MTLLCGVPESRSRVTWLTAVWLAFLPPVGASGESPVQKFTGAAGEVHLITLDPGHFHAALVQKTMYAQVAPLVHVYALPGPDITEHLKRIDGFNTRTESPTAWQERVYTGPDYLERLLAERAGNMVVISGNNRRKAEYIKACVEAGLNVLADKPMCIDAAGCKLLQEAFATAEEKGVLHCDIMTERSDITTILQRELIRNRALFGELQPGSPDQPAVVKESVHHFYKTVASNPLKRPGWYFDTSQQGEGIVDVTTHLVDLVMWTCFPERAIDFEKDVRMLKARRWPTAITPQQFEQVTGLKAFPDFLRGKLDKDGALSCYANGEMMYILKGMHVKIAVRWDFQAAEGGGDTHHSLVRGSNANVIIRQGKEQGYRPELYVEPVSGEKTTAMARALEQAVAGWQVRYPSVALRPTDTGWQILIPDRCRVGHEAHFQEVTQRYLKYLVDGKLPPWEMPNMLTKYRITTAALDLAR